MDLGVNKVRGKSHLFVFQLRIKGRFEKLLPVHLHVLDDYYNWFCSSQDNFMTEFSNLVLSNLELIESKAHLDGGTDGRLSRLVGSNIIIAFGTSKSNTSYSFLTVENNQQQDIKVSSISSFSLNPVWIFPSNSTNQYQLLPIDVG